MTVHAFDGILSFEGRTESNEPVHTRIGHRQMVVSIFLGNRRGTRTGGNRSREVKKPKIPREADARVPRGKRRHEMQLRRCSELSSTSPRGSSVFAHRFGGACSPGGSGACSRIQKWSRGSFGFDQGANRCGVVPPTLSSLGLRRLIPSPSSPKSHRVPTLSPESTRYRQ